MMHFVPSMCLVGFLTASSGVPDRMARVSAGVYESGPNGRLVRTLFSRGVVGSDGATVRVEWDGMDDWGVVVPECTGGSALNSATVVERYVVRGVSAHLSYVWEGVVGNSGATQVGLNVWRSLYTIADVDCDPASQMCTASFGYCERGQTSAVFSANDMNSPVYTGHEDYHSDVIAAATDGAVAYYANTGVPVAKPSYYFSPFSFTYAVNISTNCEVQFDFGKPACNEVCCAQHHWPNAATQWNPTSNTFSPSFLPSPVQGWNQPNCTPQFDGCNGAEQFFSSTIDFQTDFNVSANPKGGGLVYPSMPSGIAVQRGTGVLLAVTHAYTMPPRITVFHKQTGATMANYSLAGPPAYRARFTQDGKSLWAVTPTGIARFDGFTASEPPKGDTIAAMFVIPKGNTLVRPAALAISPLDDSVWICDEELQQVFVFDGSKGSLLRTYGTARGYTAALGPTVRDDVFDFANSSYITVLYDGSFILGDQGNRRTLRVAANGTVLHSLSFLPASYASAVPAGDSTRVFSNFLEFHVDYSVALGQPGSWKLVRNWIAGTDPAFGGHGQSFQGPTSVVVLPNGRTFGHAGLWPADSKNNSRGVLFELVSPGPDVSTNPGGIVPIHQIATMPKDGLPNGGSLDQVTAAYHFPVTINDDISHSHYQMIVAAPLVIDPITGSANWTCDVSHLPTLGAGCVVLASFNISSNNSLSLMVRSASAGVTGGAPLTADRSQVLIFDNSKFQNGNFHFGAASVNQTEGSLLWQASPWGTWELHFNFTVLEDVNVSIPWLDPATLDGRYGANETSLSYAATRAVVDPSGPSALFGFHGEGWKQAEANQYLHWHSPTGLFLGQFGRPNKDALQASEPGARYVQPGKAGNSFCPSLVRAPCPPGQAASCLYLYHNDESHHDGVHRWRLDGVDTITELAWTPLHV